MRKLFALLACSLAVLSEPALAAPDSKAVRVLMDSAETGSAASTGNTAMTQITVGPFGQKAVVYVTANGEANYRGATGNAGTILFIKAGDHLIRDDSFEGESSSMQYHSAASHMFVLPRGETQAVEAQVIPYGGQAVRNTNAKVHMHVVAIAAE